MKGRKLFVVMLVLVTLLSIVSAEAAVQAVSASPALSFEGNTAICGGTCTADSTGNEVSMRLSLYEGDVFLDTWGNAGDGYAMVQENYSPVYSGHTYTLTLRYSVNGVSQRPVSVTATCP